MALCRGAPCSCIMLLSHHGPDHVFFLRPCIPAHTPNAQCHWVHSSYAAACQLSPTTNLTSRRMPHTLQVSVLDKSKADWNTLKSSDAALEEELEAHKRSGGQYLDKVGQRGSGCSREGMAQPAARDRVYRGERRASVTDASMLPASANGGKSALGCARMQVDFLKRAELREYEQERDKRLASDMRTRGRL